MVRKTEIDKKEILTEALKIMENLTIMVAGGIIVGVILFFIKLNYGLLIAVISWFIFVFFASLVVSYLLYKKRERDEYERDIKAMRTTFRYYQYKKGGGDGKAK